MIDWRRAKIPPPLPGLLLMASVEDDDDDNDDDDDIAREHHDGFVVVGEWTARAATAAAAAATPTRGSAAVGSPIGRPPSRTYAHAHNGPRTITVRARHSETGTMDRIF